MLGYLVGNKVVIRDEKEASKLYNKGKYGTLEENKLTLSLVEALYLVERKKLKVFKGEEELDYDALLKLAAELEPRFWVRFCVYRDIRKRGYITKTALKYGADFRVYDRGDVPGKDHAKWVLFAVNENDIFDWKRFAAMNRVAHSVRKSLLIGVVDDEGDVTYYEVRWKRP
ncbi:MAG: tRNA-intron lyase [Nanoarchaeota archaeon]|nr:tRNA-intron lyase [Nanoarchaeota archaeon]